MSGKALPWLISENTDCHGEKAGGRLYAGDQMPPWAFLSHSREHIGMQMDLIYSTIIYAFQKSESSANFWQSVYCCNQMTCEAPAGSAYEVKS